MVVSMCDTETTFNPKGRHNQDIYKKQTNTATRTTIGDGGGRREAEEERNIL